MPTLVRSSGLGSSVESAEITDLTIVAGDLADDAVTYAKLAVYTTDYIARCAAFGGGDATAIGAGSTAYLPLSGDLAPNATEGSVSNRAVRAGTVLECALDVSINASTGAGSVTLRINGSDTGLTAAIGAGVTGVITLTGATPAIAARDTIDIKIVAGTGGNLTVRSIQTRIGWA